MIDSSGQIVSINRSTGGIPKHAVDAAVITAAGLDGDAHDHEKHNRPEQAICLWDLELLDELNGEGFGLAPGSIGENLTVRDLDVQHLPIGTVLYTTGGARLEITKRRNPCFVLDAIDPTLKTAIRDRCGAYARVLAGGTVSKGEALHATQPPGHDE